MSKQSIGLPRIQNISVEVYPTFEQQTAATFKGMYTPQEIPYGSVLHFPSRRFILQMRSETDAYLAIGPEIPFIADSHENNRKEISRFLRGDYIKYKGEPKYFVEEYSQNVIGFLVENYGDTDNIPFGPYRGHGVLNVIQDEKRKEGERLHAVLKFENVLLNALPENFVGMILDQFDISCTITFEEVN